MRQAASGRLSHAGLVLAIVALGACGSRVDPATPAPTTGPSTTLAPPAGDARPDPGSGEPLSVEEALDATDGSAVTVTGALFAEGDEVRLCSALAESFPPQCGGAALAVDGLDLSDYDLEEAQGIRWSDSPVELSGTVSDGVLRVA